MRNKKLKKVILASFSIFTFTGAIVSLNLDSISKLQMGISNNPSLNSNSVNSINEVSELVPTINDVSTSNRSTRARTTIARKTDTQTTSFINTTYPFQFVNNRDFLQRLVEISNTPADFNINNDVVFSISGINNLAQQQAQPLTSGRGNVQVVVNKYIDDSGNTVSVGQPGIQPLIANIIIPDFRSVRGQTVYSPNPLFAVGSNYASDVGTSIDVSNVFEVVNGTGTGLGDQGTKVNVSNITFDNGAGRLRVSYTLSNYFNQQGQYVVTPTTIQEIELNGFKIVPGATTFGVKSTITPNALRALIPSAVAAELERDFKNFTKFFEVTNSPEAVPDNSISGIKNIIPNDMDGTIQLTYTIIGEYFDSRLVKQKTSQNGEDFNVTISGLNSQAEKVDIIPIVIGGSVGGVALIAIIVVTILLVSRSKKKKSEELRKQKLSSKVSPPSGDSIKPTSTTTPVPGATSMSGPKPPVPPSSVNRPVPPPIRK